MKRTMILLGLLEAEAVLLILTAPTPPNTSIFGLSSGAHVMGALAITTFALVFGLFYQFLMDHFPGFPPKRLKWK